MNTEANVVIFGFPGEDESRNAGVLNKKREWPEVEMQVIEDCVRVYAVGNQSEAVTCQYMGHLRVSTSL